MDENEKPKSIFMIMEGDVIYDISQGVPTVTLAPDEQEQLLNREFFLHPATLTFHAVIPIKDQRILGMVPPPRKLTRKRMVKLLMSYGIQRDRAMFSALFGMVICGSYAAAWKNIMSEARGRMI